MSFFLMLFIHEKKVDSCYSLKLWINFYLKFFSMTFLIKGVNTCGDLYLKRGEIKLLFSQLSFENYMQISQVTNVCMYVLHTGWEKISLCFGKFTEWWKSSKFWNPFIKYLSISEYYSSELIQDLSNKLKEKTKSFV